MDDLWTPLVAFVASWVISVAWIVGFYILVHPSIWLGWSDQLRELLP
jgi:hypothetical protein